jgi:peroxiredoxin
MMSLRLALGWWLLSLGVPAGAAEPWTVLFGGRVITLDRVRAEENALWVSADDLPEMAGFTLKPEGFCSSQRCVPIPRPDAAWIRREEGSTWVELNQFALQMGQPIAIDSSRRLVGMGLALADRSTLLERGQAPDFALPDRQGKIVRLSDFRGKKVLLLTWASWCGCSADLVHWQKVYEKLQPHAFEIVAVAQDSQGESAAGKYYDRAKASYTTLIDVDHTVTALYQMVNVPTGVWIDEEGRVVRPPEVAYTPSFRLLGRKVGDDRYLPALEDWVIHGRESRFLANSKTLRDKLAPRSAERRRADIEFQLGSHLFAQGDREGAIEHWQAAQKLDPDNWNYHRQEWSLDPQKAITLWMKKVQELRGKPYYEPIALPDSF